MYHRATQISPYRSLFLVPRRSENITNLREEIKGKEKKVIR